MRAYACFSFASVSGCFNCFTTKCLYLNQATFLCIFVPRWSHDAVTCFVGGGLVVGVLMGWIEWHVISVMTSRRVSVAFQSWIQKEQHGSGLNAFCLSCYNVYWRHNFRFHDLIFPSDNAFWAVTIWHVLFTLSFSRMQFHVLNFVVQLFSFRFLVLLRWGEVCQHFVASLDS